MAGYMSADNGHCNIRCGQSLQVTRDHLDRFVVFKYVYKFIKTSGEGENKKKITCFAAKKEKKEEERLTNRLIRCEI